MESYLGVQYARISGESTVESHRGQELESWNIYKHDQPTRLDHGSRNVELIVYFLILVMTFGAWEVFGLGLFGALLNIGPIAAQSQDGTSPTSTTPEVLTATMAGEVVTYSPQFTVPASADQGASLLPNIQDPDAIDAQSVCPGYTASNVVNGPNGFSATLSLAGAPCKYITVPFCIWLYTHRIIARTGMMSINSISLWSTRTPIGCPSIFDLWSLPLTLATLLGLSWMKRWFHGLVSNQAQVKPATSSSCGTTIPPSRSK